MLAADYKKVVAGIFDAEHILAFGVKHRAKDRDTAKQTYEINSLGVKTVTTNPNDTYSLNESITALYAMDEIILNSRLSVQPGVRMEKTRGEYVTGGGQRGEGDYTDWNPSLHATWKMGDGYHLKASAAKTISRPAFKDMVPTQSVKPDKIEEGNPSLKAARSMNYNLGIEKYIGKTGIVAVGAFHKDIKDVIEKQVVGYVGPLPVYKPVNVSDSTVRGVELEVRGGLERFGVRHTTVAANYTYLDSQVRDPNTGAIRRLVDQPRSIANIVLRHENPSGFAASLGINRIDEKLNMVDPAKPKREAPYTQWDISLSQKLFAGREAVLSVTNLFGAVKRKVDGAKTEVEEPGKTYFLGIKGSL